MKMVALVLFSIISPAHGISHSRAFHMMLTKCRSPKKNKEKLHIDYISQQHRAWSTFILGKSNGFTRPGVERINESIRTYCWAILGSQSQIKSDFLLILKMQSKALWICPARLFDTRMHSNTHAPRWIMYLGLVCTWHPVIWNCG